MLFKLISEKSCQNNFKNYLKLNHNKRKNIREICIFQLVNYAQLETNVLGAMNYWEHYAIEHNF